MIRRSLLKHVSCPVCGKYVGLPISSAVYRAVNRPHTNRLRSDGSYYCCPAGHGFIVSEGQNEAFGAAIEAVPTGD